MKTYFFVNFYFRVKVHPGTSYTETQLPAARPVFAPPPFLSLPSRDSSPCLASLFGVLPWFLVSSRPPRSCFEDMGRGGEKQNSSITATTGPSLWHLHLTLSTARWSPPVHFPSNLPFSSNRLSPLRLTDYLSRLGFFPSPQTWNEITPLQTQAKTVIQPIASLLLSVHCGYILLRQVVLSIYAGVFIVTLSVRQFLWRFGHG